MEIERKFRIYRNQIPFDISGFPSKEIRQGYILHSPALRIRKENEDYILTYKGRGSLSREEINITLPEAAGEKLFTKCDGHLIDKTRYLIPANAKDATSGRDLVIEPSEAPADVQARQEYPQYVQGNLLLPEASSGIRPFSSCTLRFRLPHRKAHAAPQAFLKGSYRSGPAR